MAAIDAGEGTYEGEGDAGRPADRAALTCRAADAAADPFGEDRPTTELPPSVMACLVEATREQPRAFAFEGSTGPMGAVSDTSQEDRPTLPQPESAALALYMADHDLAPPTCEQTEGDGGLGAELRTTDAFVVTHRRAKSRMHRPAFWGGVSLAALPLLFGAIQILADRGGSEHASVEVAQRAGVPAGVALQAPSDKPAQPLAPRVRGDGVGTGVRDERPLQRAQRARGQSERHAPIEVDDDSDDAQRLAPATDSAPAAQSRASSEVLVSINAQGLAREATSVRVEVNGLVLETAREQWPLELVVFRADTAQGQDLSLRAWGLVNGEVVGATQRASELDAPLEPRVSLALDPEFDAGSPPPARMHPGDSVGRQGQVRLRSPSVLDPETPVARPGSAQPAASPLPPNPY